MADLAPLLRLPGALLDTAVRGAALAPRLLDVLSAALEDGSLERIAGGLLRLSDVLASLEGLPAALSTVETLPESLAGLTRAIGELRAEITAVPARLDELLREAVPVLRRLQEVLPALGDTTRVLGDLTSLPGLVERGEALAAWVERDLAPQRDALPAVLQQLNAEVLPMLTTLSSTGADVVALRGAVERLVTVLDGVGAQLGQLPGAALIRRRAAASARSGAAG